MALLNEEQRRVARQLLDETIAHYNLSNRAVEPNGSCFYAEHESDKRCAIGRIMTDEAIEEVLNKNLNGLVDFLPLKDFVKKPYDMLGRRFLGMIQSLHDKSHNWDERGLTLRGKEKANEIIDFYDLGEKYTI